MAPSLPSLLNRRPKVSVSFYDERETYTNGDRVHGHVTVSSQIDKAFSSVEVAFLGTCQTHVDGSITSAGEFRSGAIQHFLKLSQADARSKLPADSILRAGHHYHIPFAFTIPARRGTPTCRHPRDSDEVRDAHLYLPPSLSDGAGNADALAPVMADVQYNVRVNITGAKESSEVIASRAKSIWFVPSSSLPASSDAAHMDDEHTTETTKALKCTLWMGKHGNLEVKSSEPQCFLSLAAGSTALNLDLDFTRGQCTSPRPPTIDTVSISLEGTTFYACSGRKAFPSKASYLMDSTQGRYQMSLKLCGMSGPDLRWDTDRMSGRQFAHIQIPIVLPSDKKIAPTFHSCLISRTYSLRLRLKLKTSGNSTSVELDVPVHVSMDGVEVLDKKALLAFGDEDGCCWDIDPVPTYSVHHGVDATA